MKQFEELEEDKYIDPDMPKCEYCKGVRYMPMMVYEGLHTSDFVSVLYCLNCRRIINTK